MPVSLFQKDDQNEDGVGEGGAVMPRQNRISLGFCLQGAFEMAMEQAPTLRGYRSVCPLYVFCNHYKGAVMADDGHGMTGGSRPQEEDEGVFWRKSGQGACPGPVGEKH